MSFETKCRLPGNSFWERSASHYDSFVFRFGTAYQRMLEWIDSVVEPSSTALEIGCGTGNISLRLGRKVLAIDNSKRMIEEARRKAASRQIERIDFQVGDAHSLHLPDSTFPVICCANALHVVKSPNSVLAEIHRVMEPGGQLLAPNYLHGQTWRARVLSYSLRLLGFRVFHRFTCESYQQLLAEAGFTEIQLTLLDDPIPIACIQARRSLQDPGS